MSFSMKVKEENSVMCRKVKKKVEGVLYKFFLVASIFSECQEMKSLAENKNWNILGLE